MTQPGSQSRPLPLLPLALAAYVLVLGLKLHFASVLDLYSDEIFYWLASTHPALAYSDLPFVTAQLVGLGSALAPGEALAVRSLFIMMGSAIPLLLYWLAKPLTSFRQALETAALSLCVPLGGFLGLLAVPDVPLIFFGLLAIGFFQRALAHDHWSSWLATGLFVALGLCTHYRFLLYVAAALLFLLLFRPEHRQWRNPRFWASTFIASCGLIPIAWFNLGNQLASASFYFVDRHPWQFQPQGLLHLFKQAALVTPLLYALLLTTAWMLWQQARRGQRDAALLLSFALVNLSVYLLLAPWTDADSTSIHWPLSGYFPLLVYLPAAIRKLGNQWPASASRFRLLITVAIVMGFAGTVSAFVGVGSQAYQQPLQSLLGRGLLSNKMAGWQEFARHTRQLIEEHYDGQAPVLITDNYYSAAQLLFADLGERVYTIDQDKAIRDGRITQLQLWQMHMADLSRETGQAALLINEDSTLEVLDKRELITQMCHRADSLDYLDTLRLFNGDKQFSYYQIPALKNESADRASPCPFPMRAWLEIPAAGDVLAGPVEVDGWAYSEDVGIERVRLLLDDEPLVELNYGIHRQDVVDVMEAGLDPNAPELGFRGSFDSTALANGEYWLAVELQNKQGQVTRYGRRKVMIRN
ncbi:MAG: glycosyltransferase family 39 protein [Pseudomonadales bacterium]|nr:glycosyltransferase family 39 protein [Pseudomonadales bacterium]